MQPEIDKKTILITSISGEDYNNLGLWDKNDADISHPFVCISCNRRFRTNKEACCARKSAEIKYGYHVNHGRV